MSRLAKYRLKINLEKSSFEKDEVKFLGNTIFGVGKRVSSSRVCAVEHFPTPTSLTALRSFLGLINFYRGFIPNCSSLLAPLFAVLKAYPWSSLYWRWFCCSWDFYGESWRCNGLLCSRFGKSVGHPYYWSPDPNSCYWNGLLFSFFEVECLHLVWKHITKFLYCAANCIWVVLEWSCFCWFWSASFLIFPAAAVCVIGKKSLNQSWRSPATSLNICHTISFIDHQASSIGVPPRCFNSSIVKIVEQQVAEMVEDVVSESPWSFPIILVKKPNGS